MRFIYVVLLCLTSFFASSQTLLLFGGEDHDVFLGCINCNNYSSDSVWNEYSEYGSKYNSKSIWNEYGSYGSEYSNDCPWNVYATNPPAIVDRSGKFYGFLTVNKYFPDRATFELALTMCKYHEDIKENVGEWGQELF